MAEPPINEREGKADLSAAKITSSLTRAEAAEIWRNADLSALPPLPLPAVKEPTQEDLRNLSEAQPPRGTPQSTASSAPKVAGEESFSFGMYDQGWVNRQVVGRIYIAGRGHCSGTMVAVDVVLTAAHCLYFNGGWSFNDPAQILFRPNQWGGSRAGQWIGHGAIVPQGWIDSGSSFMPLDYGFIRLATGNDGTEAGDEVGWAGIVTQYVSDMWSLGYPATGIFFSQWGGDYPYYCYSPYGHHSTWSWGADTFYNIGIGCTMTGGASGGPWFTSYNGAWNHIASVNSHCYNSMFRCKDFWSETMWGPYFTQATINLLNQAKQL